MKALIAIVFATALLTATAVAQQPDRPPRAHIRRICLTPAMFPTIRIHRIRIRWPTSCFRRR